MQLDVLLTWEQGRPHGMMELFKLHPCQEAVMLSIPQAVARIKANVANALPERTVRQLVADLPRTYHERTLTPAVTTYLCRRKARQGNTAVGNPRHLGGFDFPDSASCQARPRLPVGFFHRLHQAVLAPCRRRADLDRAARWHGHRVYLL